MRLDLFHYNLPEGSIASEPCLRRSDSRLLMLTGATGALEHRSFNDIIELLEPGDLLVMNDTRVIPARLFGKKATGGQLEVLVERVLDDGTVLAHIRASKSPKPGAELYFPIGDESDKGSSYCATVTGREAGLFVLEFKGDVSVMEVLEAVGHIPLPPYIERADTGLDRERYQTVYAQRPGAVAAPTAGLHFDQDLLNRLREKGVNTGFVTLHVGAGTFQPVRVANVEDHVMHSEIVEVGKVLCEQVEATRAAGKRVIAVGTTSVRCLETAGRSGVMLPMQGETDIFIYPGYRFRMVDVLITNFHLPESTLLMLVSAFGGYRNIQQAYAAAVAERYRFFSYGDAMFITLNPQACQEQLP